MHVTAILTAAGSGERLGAGIPKALVEISGQTLVAWAAQNLRASGVVNQIVVTCPPAMDDAFRNVLQEFADIVVAGGETRQASIAGALRHVSRETNIVLVHDAARPFAPPRLIRDVVAAVASGHPAVIPGVPVTDTIKRIDAAASVVVETVPRGDLRAIQTPQGFRRAILDRAYARASDTHTDDAGLVESIGIPVVVVPGDPAAMKITTPADLAYAQIALALTD
jgi:2-C-methyl-D-erythritol 4-phosphate cytidylyltransferase